MVPAALEYADAAAIAMFDHYAPSGYPTDAGALLLIDLDGTADQVAAELPVVEAVLRQAAREVRRADDAATRAELWRGRLHAAHAIVATGQQSVTCDTTVPPSRIPALQQAITTIAARHHLTIPTLGHAGDGNLHPVILFDGDDPAQRVAAAQVHEELTAAALDLGGTITGEHGVGSEKRHSMAQRFRPAEIAAMRAVKTAFDPAGLLNPGILVAAAQPGRTGRAPICCRRRAAVDARRHDREVGPLRPSRWPRLAGRRDHRRRRQPHRHRRADNTAPGAARHPRRAWTCARRCRGHADTLGALVVAASLGARSRPRESARSARHSCRMDRRCTSVAACSKMSRAMTSSGCTLAAGGCLAAAGSDVAGLAPTRSVSEHTSGSQTRRCSQVCFSCDWRPHWLTASGRPSERRPLQTSCRLLEAVDEVYKLAICEDRFRPLGVRGRCDTDQPDRPAAGLFVQPLQVSIVVR